MATTSNTRTSDESKKPPVAKIRVGLITASIWERATDNGTFYSVSFERRYRDAKQEWHSTRSFDASNLLSLAKLADLAHTEIARLSQKPAEAA